MQYAFEFPFIVGIVVVGSIHGKLQLPSTAVATGPTFDLPKQFIILCLDNTAIVIIPLLYLYWCSN